MKKNIVMCLMVLLWINSFNAFSEDMSTHELKQRQRDAEEHRKQLKIKRDSKIVESQQMYMFFEKMLLSKDLKRQSKTDSHRLEEINKLLVVENEKISVFEKQYQKQMANILKDFEEKAVTKKRLPNIKNKAKKYSLVLFEARKESDKKLLDLRILYIRNGKNNSNGLVQKLRKKANSLGLLESVKPIIAESIGEKLSNREIQWNKKEKTNVSKLEKKNQSILILLSDEAEVVTDKKISLLNNDYTIDWEWKGELNKLHFENDWLAILSKYSIDGIAINKNQMNKKIKENNRKLQQINREYRKKKKMRNKSRRNSQSRHRENRTTHYKSKNQSQQRN